MEGMQEETGVINPMHNSQNSLDWADTYSGILPCADCMGIQTVITLNKNNTYESSLVYLGKSERKIEETGSFSWEKDGSILVLSKENESMNIYKVEENQLRMLDQEGQKIEGVLAENYLLHKVASPIVNKYWKAVEIMGRTVEVNENMNRAPHLIIRSNGEFSGGGGCNSFFGKFKLEGKNGITFSDLAITEMVCSFEHFDQELVEALNNSRQFIMEDEEHMQLIVGKRAALAKFKAIYF